MPGDSHRIIAKLDPCFGAGFLVGRRFFDPRRKFR
jgi:hypothetical protein